MTQYTAKNDDFTEFEENEKLAFVREDRNGSRYYTTDICPKCGGTGYLPQYDYVEGGVCFLCDGTGVHTTTYKVLTESYSKKMAEKRLAKLRKEAAGKNVKFLADNGFSADGKTWVVLGNTFEIKEELKEAGAKYSRTLGWAFPEKPEKYDTLELSKDTEIEQKYSSFDEDQANYFNYSDEKITAPEHIALVEEDHSGAYEFTRNAYLDSWLRDKKHERELELKAERGAESEYVGEIGERITVDVELVRTAEYKTHYTYYGEYVNVFTMKDKDGNLFVWKTSAYPEAIESGKQFTIKGTVKNHSEYNGEKQTELTRCKAVSKVVKIESEEKHEEANYEADKAIREFLDQMEA